MSAIINRTQYWCKTLKTNASFFTLMIASPRLGKEPKISMLKLDTIRKEREEN
jgi:hypothetical protein